METHVSRLADINKRIEDAIHHLREQQTLMSIIDCPRCHQALLILLSNGLRVYCWLEAQHRGLKERLGEYLPLQRK